MLHERELGLSESYSCFCHDKAEGTTNIVGYTRLSGELDLFDIKQSLNNMISRHDTLRSIFIKNKNHTLIKIQKTINTLPITYREEQNPNWEQIIEKHHNTKYDENQINWRLEVIKSGEQHHIFACFHHAISDGKSVSMFLSELLQGCESSAAVPHQNRPLLPTLESLLQRKIKSKCLKTIYLKVSCMKEKPA